MSGLLEGPFNFAANMSKRTMTIERPNEFAPESISVSVSNYSRDLAITEDVTSKGQEFVITKQNLLKTSNYLIIKKMDILNDPELGQITISEVRPMIAMGTLVGWRVRTS